MKKIKSSVAATLGGAVFAIVLAGYLISYATTVRDPVEWKNGDMVVQNANAVDVLPVFAADGSGMTHMGIVEVTDEGAFVIEATNKVVSTPMREFLQRSQDSSFSVYRIAALSDEQRAKVVASAKRQMGKPGDYFLRRSWDAFYSSELVRVAYSDIGFDLGRLQRISRVASDLSNVQSQLMRNFTSDEDCAKRNFDMEQCWTYVAKQEVITPSSIVTDAHVMKIFEKKPKENTFALIPGAESESEAPAAN